MMLEELSCQELRILMIFRSDWIRCLKVLHIDSYKKIKHLDGYKINLRNIENLKLKKINFLIKVISIRIYGS